MLLLAKPCCLLTVTSDITNMSVLMLFSFATFHNDHISKVISDARAFSRCQFLKILLMGRPHRRRFGRDLVPFQGRAAAACAPAVSCWVCCCFAEGLWEVLALWGQLRTPPSSCSDRHQALTQTFSLFHFISGLSNGPLPRSSKTWVLQGEQSIQVSKWYTA